MQNVLLLTKKNKKKLKDTNATLIVWPKRKTLESLIKGGKWKDFLCSNAFILLSK